MTTGRQAAVGWLGLGLVVANIIDGALRGTLSLLTQGGTHGSGGGGSSGAFGIPDIPLIPQGPVTGLPFSPITDPTQPKHHSTPRTVSV